MSVNLDIAHLALTLPELLGLGLCVGVLAGFFGAGGRCLLVPLLDLFGVDMSVAIGTDLSTAFGQAALARRHHGRLGRVDPRLALLSALGAVIGVELAAQSVMALERIGHVATLVRATYMTLLFGLAAYLAYEHVRATREEARGAPRAAAGRPWNLAQRVRALRIPPMMALPASGLDEVSAPVLLGLAMVAGFGCGAMGGSGGAILLPSLMYFIGCPAVVAVGTSLVCVLVMTAYGALSYALKGRADLVAAGVLLLGVAAGGQLGALATRYLRGRGLRLLFAIMILLVGLAVAMKQAQELLGLSSLGASARTLVLAAAGGMALLVLLALVRGAAGERARAEGYGPRASG
jgi:uncharacterized protein